MATRTRASPFLLLLACSARAAPLQLLDRRDNSNSTLASRQIWGIAVGVVCAFVLSMGLLFYYRRFRARRRSSTRPANTSTWSLSALLSPSPRPPSSTNPSGNIRELTAEQLIGTQATRTGTAAANNAPPPTAANRRNRRPRRTPSQMSTTSLPAYNKEPGEEEVVVYRGTEDLEDNPLPPHTIVIPPVSEDGDEDSRAGHSSHSHYPPLPESPHDMPLLNNEESHDEQRPPHDNNVSQHGRSGSEGSALARPAVNEEDPRGAAPAYFEVVESDAEATAPNGATISPSELAAPPADSQQTTRNRRSIRGFRNLFQTRLGGGTQNPNAPSVPEEPTAHNRGLSVASAATSRSSTSHGHPRGHRPSNSLFSLNAFQRTNSRLSTAESYAPEHANASMISLNSIGAPLSHTVTRTSFMYPRSGMPTPEQVQLISSRENLSRFGVPFGDEAVRFASTSRVDLSLDAPPDFDESERAHSRQRSHSSAGIGDDIEEGDESQHVDATHRTEPPAAYDGLPASSSSSPPPLSVPAVTTVTGEPVADSPAEMFVTGEAPSSSPPAAAAEQATPDVTSPIVPAKDDKPAASPIAADFEPASPAGPPKSMSGSISSVAQSAASLKDDSRAGSPSMTDFGPPLSAGPPTSTRGRRGPPSAFKPSLLTDPPRSESRASTMTAQTFQTANDGEDTDAYFSDFGEDEHSPGRRTPTGNGLSVASRRSAHESMTLGHALEATDATIVPGRSAAVGA